MNIIKKRMLIIMTAGIAMSAFTGCEKEDSSNTTAKIEKGENLTISADNLSEKASFYPITVDDMEMEVLAVKDSNSEIRTAFNTCQICYSSGKGYYEQVGDTLVCQNCGNTFTMDQVGTVSGGCNPWPILEEDRTITDDQIEISYDFLKDAKSIFSNWKKSF